MKNFKPKKNDLLDVLKPAYSFVSLLISLLIISKLPDSSSLTLSMIKYKRKIRNKTKENCIPQR